jgi:hypothetical protein
MALYDCFLDSNLNVYDEPLSPRTSFFKFINYSEYKDLDPI